MSSQQSYCGRCLTTFAGQPGTCPSLACRASRPRAGWGRILDRGALLDRHYRVERVLALGGAGISYLARAVDERGVPQPPDLAIKVLFAERAGGSYLRRLANEAQVLQDLAHPCIVRCKAFVQRAGQEPYLVTLFERGGTLAEHVQRVGPLPPAVACDVLEQVLRGLEVAHRAGIVHRDLKPANVLLAEAVEHDVAPRVRLADFGIAKMAMGLGAGRTQVGVFVGTPEYAAPEQYEGLEPSWATDIYAAGGLLCFLLTGSPPVQLSSRVDPARCLAQLRGQLPPRLPSLGLAPAIHAELQLILDHSVTSAAEERWPVARLAQHVRALAGSGSATDRGEWVPTAAAASADADATLLPEDIPAEWRQEPEKPTRKAGYLPSKPAPSGPDQPAGPANEVPLEALPTIWEGMDDPQQDAVGSAAVPPSEDLSLDDLLGGPAQPAGPAAAPARPDPAPAAAVPSPARATAAPPKQPSPLDAQAAFLIDPRDEAAARATAAARLGPALQEEEGRWRAQRPQPLPADLPEDPAQLLALLGAVGDRDRAPLLASLRRVSLPELGRALRVQRMRGDRQTRRGVALAIAELAEPQWTSVARALLQDKRASVRCCAAQAMGAVASGSFVAQLARLLEDPQPLVRGAAARGLAEACYRTRDSKRGFSWLARLESDSDPEVGCALRRAHEILEGQG